MGDIKDVKIGLTQVNKIYCGNDLVFEKIIDTTPPITTVYPNPADSLLTHYAGTKVWLEVNEMCTTYYTLDGSTPTTASAIFREPFTLNKTTTIKYFSIDVAGNIETVKTTIFDITETSITTISPSETVQNTIPFTVTLSNNTGNTIYYRIGTGSQQTYNSPFEVNQNSTGVFSTNIIIYYWSTGEAEKSITYNTINAIAGKPIVSVLNGINYIRLNWAVTANTTSYNVYRSTVEGEVGILLNEYQTHNYYDDTTVIGGTTYYYTVRAANFGNGQNSDQVIAMPISSIGRPAYRYLKIEGHGAFEAGQEATTRIVEVEAFAGDINVLAGKTAISYQTIDTGSTDIKTITDGSKTGASGTYPVWWLATPNANVIFDFGYSQPLSKLAYYGYSLSSAQRANQFRILGSNTNNGTDWVELWNMSNNTVLQPILPLGYQKNVYKSPNLLSNGLDIIDNWTDTSFMSDTYIKVSTEQSMSGKSIKWGSPPYGHVLHLAKSITDYNIQVEAGKRYILSTHTRSDMGFSYLLGIKASDGTIINSPATSQAIAAGWIRHYMEFIAPTNALLVRFTIPQANILLYLDNFMLEEADAGQTQPKIWTPYQA